jgi:hypothetical protein
MESVHDNLVYVDFQNRRMSPNQNAALEEFAEWSKISRTITTSSGCIPSLATPNPWYVRL